MVQRRKKKKKRKRDISEKKDLGRRDLITDNFG